MHDRQGQQPMETEGAEPGLSKKQQRDAARLQEYQEKKCKQYVAHWLLLVQALLRRSHRNLRDGVWTGWMRSVLVRKKLRSLLWRAWTRQSVECKETVEKPCRGICTGAQGTRLSTCSPRDVYILYRARAFATHVPQLVELQFASKPLQKYLQKKQDHAEGWETERHRLEMERMMLETDFDPQIDGSGSPAAGRLVTTRSREEAGLKNPTSAKGGRSKKRGGAK